MSDIKILGVNFSTCTRRVLYTAALLNLPIELVPIEFLKGQHKSPEHMALQPFGKIPVLEQGDFILYESRAISRYLNDSISTTHSLIPSDPQQRALFEQWASLELGTFNDPIGTIVYGAVFYKFFGGQYDSAAVKAGLEKLKVPLSVLDKQLSKHDYITGDSISLVDIWLVPNLWALQEGSPEDAKMIVESSPNISGWWKRVTATPEWQKIVTPS